jgi:hypothetical protein
MTMMCKTHNKAKQDGFCEDCQSAVSPVPSKPLLAEVKALRKVLDDVFRDIVMLSDWRAQARAHDIDMGNPVRDYLDTEEWENMESEATRIMEYVLEARERDTANDNAHSSRVSAAKEG